MFFIVEISIGNLIHHVWMSDCKCGWLTKALYAYTHFRIRRYTCVWCVWCVKCSVLLMKNRKQHEMQYKKMSFFKWAEKLQSWTETVTLFLCWKRLVNFKYSVHCKSYSVDFVWYWMKFSLLIDPCRQAFKYNRKHCCTSAIVYT